MTTLTPDLLLNAYCQGVFPMGRSRDDPELVWLSPDPRGVFPLDGFIVSKSLRKTLRSARFTVTADHCFRRVMEACAAPMPDREDREDTWITPQILSLYTILHEHNWAHSIECWHEGNLVGGLYGVSIGGVFFGESMFSLMSNASKVALIHLGARLRAGKFVLLDTQFVTPHLESLGALEIPRKLYLQELAEAIELNGNFTPNDDKIATELENICVR